MRYSNTGASGAPKLRDYIRVSTIISGDAGNGGYNTRAARGGSQPRPRGSGTCRSVKVRRHLPHCNNDDTTAARGSGIRGSVKFRPHFATVTMTTTTRQWRWRWWVLTTHPAGRLPTCRRPFVCHGCLNSALSCCNSVPFSNKL